MLSRQNVTSAVLALLEQGVLSHEITRDLTAEQLGVDRSELVAAFPSDYQWDEVKREAFRRWESPSHPTRMERVYGQRYEDRSSQEVK